MPVDCRFKTAVPAARFVGDPVDVVTGAVISTERDFQLPGPFELLWRRHYDSRRSQEQNGCGLGFRFEYDRTLCHDLDGLRYLAPDGSEVHFPALEIDGSRAVSDGFALQRISGARFALHRDDEPSMEFVFGDPMRPARIARLWNEEHSVAFGYDEHGRLHTVADGLGRVVTVGRDALGRMQRVQLRDAARNVDQPAAGYEYDDAGRLVRTTDPYGHHARYTYDRAGRLVRSTDRTGYGFHYRYDENGRCVHTRGDDGVEELTLVYDPMARMTTATRGNGGVWQYFYDEYDALTQVIDPNGGTTEYQYGKDHELLREIDPNKQIIEYEYDESGALRVLALPNGEGLLPGQEQEPFIPIMRRYRVHRLPNPAHRAHGWRPDSPARWEQGALLKAPFALPVQDAPLRFLSGEEWSALVRSEQPGSGPPREVRDSFGLVVRQERHDGRSRQYRYDPNGNPARVSDFDGAQTTYEYASWNALVRITDPLGHVTTLAYDKDENLAALDDPAGVRSAFVYDRVKHLVELRRGGHLHERLTNDLGGRVVERCAPDGSVQLRIEYAADGSLAKRTLASGEEQSFEYREGALLACTSAAGRVELKPTVDGGYDLCDLRDGLGIAHDRSWGGTDTTTILERFTIKYYLFPDRATQLVVAPGDLGHRIHRCGGGVIRRELHHGPRETSQYSPQGRVLVRLRVAADGSRHDTFYTYSGEGDLLQVADSERGITRYQYDAAHRLLRVDRPASAEEQEDTYEYDPAGNLLHMPGLNYFGHEPDDEQAPFDASVLRPSTHGVWLQGQNQLYRAHGDYFTYDARGHLAERRGAGGITRYRYDELDQLIAYEDANGMRVTFAYDALGRRARKDTPQGSWQYYWNGDRLAAEAFPDGRLRIYVYADIDNAIVPFSFVDYPSVDADPQDGSHYFISTNHLGAPEIVQDRGGHVVWQAAIEPYGQARIETGRDFHQPLRFPGHYYDAETQLHYNRYRYYVPALGRYLQADPIDIEGGHNLYAYAHDSNPLRDVDVLGWQCPEQIRKQAEQEGLITADGYPGKPLSQMTRSQKQRFCAARAQQLSNKVRARYGDKAANMTTINVRMVKDKNGKHKLIVTSSSDDGTLPKPVRDAMHRPGEEPAGADGQPVLGPDGKPVRHLEESREPTSPKLVTEKGETREVLPNGETKPYDKGGDNNPKGQTDHHAEQRGKSATASDETVLADGPSKPCCIGCQQAIDTDNVHPDLRQTDKSKRILEQQAQESGG